MRLEILHPALLVFLQTVPGTLDLDQAIATRAGEVHQVREAAAVVAQVLQDALEYHPPVCVFDTFEREPYQLQIECLPVDQGIHQSLFLPPTRFDDAPDVVVAVDPGPYPGQ